MVRWYWSLYGFQNTWVLTLSLPSTTTRVPIANSLYVSLQISFNGQAKSRDVTLMSNSSQECYMRISTIYLLFSPNVSADLENQLRVTFLEKMCAENVILMVTSSPVFSGAIGIGCLSKLIWINVSILLFFWTYLRTPIYRARIRRIHAKPCESRIVYLNQKRFLESNHGCGDSVYKSELPEVQINLHLW